MSRLLVFALVAVSTRAFANDAAPPDAPAAPAAPDAPAAPEATPVFPAPSDAAQTSDPEQPRRHKRHRRRHSPIGDSVGLVMLEGITGALVAAGIGTVGFVGVVAGGWGDSLPLTLAGSAVLVAGPAIAGRLVCASGRESEDFEGDCGWSIGGAYLGMLVFLPPTVILRMAADHGASSTFATVVLIGGYALGTATGATFGWNRSKRPRSPDLALQPITRAGPPPTAMAAWTEPLVRPSARYDIAATQLAVPLLAFAF